MIRTPSKPKTVKKLTRRQLLQSGLWATAAVLGPWPASAYKLLNEHPERTLSLLNTHTGERLCRVVYWQFGRYLEPSLAEINHLLRDHRTGHKIEMDAAVLDCLFALRSQFSAEQPFEIISGYRSPETNRLLRRTSAGVAKQSYHVLGQAIDLRLPGVPLNILHKAALQLQRGGVGYYPKSNFIHIDSGPVRSW